MKYGWIKYLILIVAVFLAGATLDTNKELSYEYIKGPAWQEEAATPIVHKVNINTADIDELCELDGIGTTLAKRIIEYRNSHPFTDINELKNVSGIGKSKFDAIKDIIEI